LLFEVLDHRPSITFKKSRRVPSVRPPKQVSGRGKEEGREGVGEDGRKEGREGRREGERGDKRKGRINRSKKEREGRHLEKKNNIFRQKAI
jgi:hypothetical protein